MILSGQAIHERLKTDQIFRQGTWDENSLKEASYALRLAPDGLMLNSKYYPPGTDYPEDYIEIEPGKIAILSTVERLDMPNDLVGKIGIRLNHALKGITGLMGIQVDPLYGSDKDDERLFVRVANLGNESVRLSSNDQVFTFELHEVREEVISPSQAKPSTWERIRLVLDNQRDSSWTYVTRVRSDLSKSSEEIQEKLEKETGNIRDYLQPVVLFGIFLIAVTILGVVITTILSLGDTLQVIVPSWVISVIWILLISTICMAAVATIAIGVVTVRRLSNTFGRRN